MAQKISPAIVIIAITGLLVTITTLGALSDSLNMSLSGTVATVNVDAYTDSACTIPCTALNVGTLSPGGTTTQTIYIKNSGTIPVTLTMATGTWSPSNAGSYVTVSWNRANYVLAAGSSVSAVLTVTVASSVGSLTTFSCTVTITGAE
jgi:hypothetical protein